MKEVVTVVTRKGQITVPAAIRKALGLKQGDKITITLSEDDAQEARIRPYESVVERTYGIFAPPGGWKGPADLKDLRRQFEEEAGREAAAEGH